jgi:hypothetical protein
VLINTFGDLITGSFNVREHGDGTVTGQYETHRPVGSNNFRIHAALDCLSIDGNLASIGGEVTLSRDAPAAPVGERVVFLVVDNGEGNTSPPDQASFLAAGAAASFPCTDQRTIDNLLLFIEDIVVGNVQVNP